MPKLQNEKKLARFDYDFSKLGGATGTINLTPNISGLTSGMIITDMYIFVEEAVTSGGSATLTVGNTDVDGFFADVFALVGSDNAIVRVGEVAGALLWDDTNDHMLCYRVSSDTALDLTVGVADLTAGKLQVYVEFMAPV